MYAPEATLLQVMLVKVRTLAEMQVRALLVRSRQQVLGHLEVLLPALFDALSAPSDRVVLEALSVQVFLPFFASCPHMGQHEHKHEPEQLSTSTSMA